MWFVLSFGLAAAACTIQFIKSFIFPICQIVALLVVDVAHLDWSCADQTYMHLTAVLTK